MAETQVGYADVNGARLYYEAAGEGHPLVLIHAGICDSRMWDEQVVVFAPHFRVIRYDVRGFGRSRMPDGPFAQHQDLHALLACLEVKRAHIIGVSMACTIALEFALAYPDMVSSLVLVAAGIDDEPSDLLRQRWQAIEAAIKAGDRARAVELELRLWVDGRGRTPEQVDRQVRELVRAMNTGNFANEKEHAESQHLDPPASARLGEIHVPTLIVYGDLDVPDVLESADMLVNGIAGAQKVVMPGTAHLPSLEQPDVFNRVVMGFLDALSPARHGSSPVAP
ncbi:MAG TPA: alpha/beta fold hydrolase [Roseiflexaceae bacterium]|nr:alpha/beta fold hydrolase [Roseiflexaceae bacterium]